MSQLLGFVLLAAFLALLVYISVADYPDDFE